MATVIAPNGAQRTVKNLGWLLRHWGEVERFEIREPTVEGWDALMVAYLEGGRRYETHWRSRRILAEWLARPVFRGLPLVWLGQRTHCGSTTG